MTGPYRERSWWTKCNEGWRCDRCLAIFCGPEIPDECCGCWLIETRGVALVEGAKWNSTTHANVVVYRGESK